MGRADAGELAGARVVVMGLGAHGGGAASARFCAQAGADVTVTDLRDEEALARSVAELSDLPVRFVLGRHDEADFRHADIVVKNPAVRRDVALLRHAARIETDVSLFLQLHHGPIIAITGTKGKSTTASALHHILREDHPTARLGGNITVSPLSFASELTGTEPIVLELSSFQLGDLLLTQLGAEATAAFTVSAVTNVMPDHQDYYASMSDYAADKALIFASQRHDSWCLLSADDRWSRAYRPPQPQRVVRVSRTARPNDDGPSAGFADGWGVLHLPESDRPVRLVEPDSRAAGEHQRTNLLYAGAAALLFGVRAETVRRRAREFPGIAHRLESLGEVRGVRFVNDSAATIAEAVLAAVGSFTARVHLIAGGSDKGVPLDAFAEVAQRTGSIHLLGGSATDRLIALLDSLGLPYRGPYRTLEDAFDGAVRAAGDGEVVLLSPGCASFGMFQNEFDRGDQFRSLVAAHRAVVE